MPIPNSLHFLDLVDGRFKGTSEVELANLFANAQDANHLVVHFHGGLVSRESAVQSAEALIPTYQEAGAYPVFFVWNSDLPSVIKNNWTEIPQEKAFQRLVKRLAQLAIGKLDAIDGRRGGGALQLPSLREIPNDLSGLSAYLDEKEGSLNRDNGDLTPDQQEQAANELNQDEILQQATAEIALGEQQAQQREMAPVRRGFSASTPARTLMSPGVREDIRRDMYKTEGEPTGRGAILLTLARNGAAIFFQVIKRYVRNRDHGLYTTIVEETLRRLYVDSLGQIAWDLMKRDTRDAFGPDPDCGGTKFLQHLSVWHKDGRRITLVGHSTGAIYIGNFLQAADAVLSADVTFEVVFLAAAATFEFMNERLPVFRRRVGKNIRTFGLGDAREHGYFEVPVLYEGSLLYMVSGMFEVSEVDMEIVGMERFFRRQHPYDSPACIAVREYLGDQIVWAKKDEIDGFRTDARKHGGFPADPLTRQSLAHILRTGFG